MTPLLKGGAVHSILEHYPNKSAHKLAPQYQPIVDKFIKTKMGSNYLSYDSMRELSFGLLPDLSITTYNDKKAFFRGEIDYVCMIDGDEQEEIIEIDSLDDLPPGCELVEILEE